MKKNTLRLIAVASSLIAGTSANAIIPKAGLATLIAIDKLDQSKKYLISFPTERTDQVHSILLEQQLEAYSTATDIQTQAVLIEESEHSAQLKSLLNDLIDTGVSVKIVPLGDMQLSV